MLLIEQEEIFFIKLPLLLLALVERLGEYVHLGVAERVKMFKLVELIPNLVNTFRSVFHQEAVTSVDVVHLFKVNFLQFIRKVTTFRIIVLIELTLIFKVIVFNDFLDERIFFYFWNSHVIIEEFESVFEETRQRGFPLAPLDALAHGLAPHSDPRLYLLVYLFYSYILL